MEKGEILSELEFGREWGKIRFRVLLTKRRQAMNVEFSSQQSRGRSCVGDDM